MYWNSFAEFIDMGGRAFYVWGALLTVFLFVVVEIIYLKIYHQQTIKNIYQKISQSAEIK